MGLVNGLDNAKRIGIVVISFDPYFCCFLEDEWHEESKDAVSFF
jgi:hypothetical protein